MLEVDKNLPSYVYHFMDYVIRGKANSNSLIRGLGPDGTISWTNLIFPNLRDELRLLARAAVLSKPYEPDPS
ncbi:unnamed protein product [Sphenostylis stenocarpa]|uniref:Uncharacterized protein n=1 Tax=Sphenostylis stenocarpa TaxID=92480 RepID=A0AA86SWK6_9FABA|nr:unnamed protein product [Sphenostylis stenocarpa]